MAAGSDMERQWAQDLERAFLDMYEQNADALFRHCMIRVRDREQAKDIVQEAFARTWLYLSEGKHVDHLRAFIYRVANNLIIDGARRKKSSSLDALIDDEGFEPRDEDAKNPEIVPQTREAMALLRSLDEIYRTVITMRFIDEMSPKEIARVLGVSENVVSVRIHRGIERLGKLMQRDRTSTGPA